MTFEKIEEIQNKAITKVNEFTTPKTVASIIQMFFVAMLSLGINLVSVGLDITSFTKPSFYISTVATAISVVLVYRATINAVYVKTESRPNVVEARNKYNSLNEKKSLNLKAYLEEYNLKTKIEVYISKVNAKIYKIEKKLIRSRRDKNIVKLNSKLENVKKLITTEYINEHISRINVKYNIVYYSDFLSLNTKSSGGAIITRPNYDGLFNKYSFKKSWMYILSTAFLSLGIITGTTEGTVGLVASIFLNVFMVVFRIGSALIQAPKIYDDTITKSILDRTMILEEYFKWEISNPENSEFQIALDKEKETIKKEYEIKSKVAIESAIKTFMEQQKP